jgi:hypothetical protein
MKDYSNYYPSINDRVISDTEILFREKLNTLDGYDILIDGVAQKVIIHNHTNPLDEYKEDRKLLCLNEVNIHRGSVVFLEGENYLTVTDIDQNITFKECKIRKTNYLLKYQDKFGNIIEVPCIATNATLYSLGVQETKVVTLPDGKLSIVLPSNANTQQIDRGLRILHYKHPYKVTFVDYSQNGLIGLVLSEDEIQDQDDLVNGIAWNPITSTPIPTPTGILIIDGSDSIVINRTQTYEVKFDDGTAHSANYSFSLNDTTLGVLTTVTNMTCTILGLSKGNLVLTATNLSTSFQITKNILVKSLL